MPNDQLTAVSDPDNVRLVLVSEQGDAFDDPTYRALLGIEQRRDDEDVEEP